MNDEERDLISKFFNRVGGGQGATGFAAGAGSVPATQPALPPIDQEANSFIADQFRRYPEAQYRITQMAIVQEAALAEMNNRLNQMQYQLEQARQQNAQQPQQQSRGFFGGLFGGGQQQPQPQRPQGPWGGQQPNYAQPGYGGPQYAPPPPQYAPNYRPGMFSGGGSGFLGSALTTAAGVAGGMVVGNALMNAFGGHHEAAGGGFFGGDQGGGGFVDPNVGTSAFDGAGVDPGGDFTSGFTDNGGGFDTGGGGFDGGGGGFDGGGGGFDGGGFDNT